MVCSCSGAVRHGVQMNEEQARVRVRDVIMETVHAVAPGIPAQVDSSLTDLIGQCSGPANGLITRKFSDHLAPLSSARNQQIAAATKRYWEQKGYHIVAADSPDGLPRVVAQTPDGIDLVYFVSTDGSSFFNANSPCAKPG
jgi:hypothetical protein